MALAIDDRGDVVGRCGTKNGPKHAVLWTLKRRLRRQLEGRSTMTAMPTTTGRADAPADLELLQRARQPHLACPLAGGHETVPELRRGLFPSVGARGGGMTLKQVVIVIAAGAAAAIMVKRSQGTKGGETVSSGSKPIEGVGTGIP